MRKSLEKEFSDIYVLNLRGNQRTSGELSRKEGGKIFGSGSRTPIAITFLVKNTQKEGQATIHYYDIGDYLSREDKLGKLKKFQSISSKKIDWQAIEPNDKADWINQRDGAFDDLIILGDKANKDNKNTVFFPYYSRGLATARDAWCYNFSEHSLIENITLSINFYNENRSKYHEAKKSVSIRRNAPFTL
jgi:predicted helicase